MNVFENEWDDPYETPDGWRSHYKRLGVGNLGIGLYELLPGQTQTPLHFHYGNDEALIVLQGRPTVRTPEGERELNEGDVVHFPKGPAGAHQLINRSESPARYLVAASHVSPEIVQYPDSGKIAALARTYDQPFWTLHRLDNEVDYFDGEQPRA